MPTNKNPNPHAFSSLSGWTKSSNSSLSSTPDGARWSGSASGTNRWLRISVPMSALSTGKDYGVASVQVRRNSGTAQLESLIADAYRWAVIPGAGGQLQGGSGGQLAATGIFIPSGKFVFLPRGAAWGAYYSGTTWPIWDNAPDDSGAEVWKDNDLEIIIRAENNKAFDFTIRGVGLYATDDYPANPVIGTDDAGWSYTQANNSKTVNVAWNRAPDGPVETLTWDWGDGTATHSGPASNASYHTSFHTYASPGVYTVKLTASNSWPGQSTFTTKSVTVPVGPFEAHFAYETDFLNVSVDATASIAPSVSPIDTYAWDWGDGNTTAASASVLASHSYAAPGTYNITLTVVDTATGRTDTEVRPVLANEVPNPDNFFVATRELLAVAFSPSIQDGTTYAWTFGDGATSSVKEPTHTYAAPGTYSVTLTVNGSLTTTQDVTVSDVYTSITSLLDAMRLEVAIPYPAGVSYNRLPNPSGELGAWGWSTPVTNSYMTGSTTSHQTADKGISGAKLIYRSSGAGTQVMYSTAVRVTAGQYASVQLQSPYVDGYYRATLEALDAAGAVIGSSATTGFQTASPTAVVRTTPYLLPAGTATARVRLNHYLNTSSGTPAVNTLFIFRRVMLATAATSGELTSLPYAEYENWHDLLGPTSDIDITREELDLGTLVATVLDSAYDPALDGRIRPGQGIRLRVSTADVSGNVSWQSIFTGTVKEADVEYVQVKGATPGPKSTRIKLSATDAVTRLTRVKEPRGVAKVDELPELLEGAGVPFMVNGSTEQVPVAQVVGWNTNASVLDQVAITRDTESGYAYVDRNNVLQVREPAFMPTVPVGTIDERAYSGIAASFNTGDCINSVTIVWLRYTPAAGAEPPSTEEVVYGPYEDAASIDEWGLRTATYTMQGVENPVTIAAKAAAILAANSQPARMISSVSLPIRYAEDLAPGKALLDLYDLVRLAYARTSTDELARVTSVRHKISAKRGKGSARPFKWTQTLGFSADGVVASPQLVPSPPAPPEPVLATLAASTAGTVWTGGGGAVSTEISPGTYLVTVSGLIRTSALTPNASTGDVTDETICTVALAHRPTGTRYAFLTSNGLHVAMVALTSAGEVRLVGFPSRPAAAFTPNMSGCFVYPK